MQPGKDWLNRMVHVVMTITEIKQTVRDFTDAARRAKKLVLMVFNYMELMAFIESISFPFLIEEKMNMAIALKIGLVSY